MEAEFILLPALTPQNTKDPMLVCVSRIWESINMKTKQIFHTNVILLDQEVNSYLSVFLLPTLYMHAFANNPVSGYKITKSWPRLRIPINTIASR